MLLVERYHSVEIRVERNRQRRVLIAKNAIFATLSIVLVASFALWDGRHGSTDRSLLAPVLERSDGYLGKLDPGIIANMNLSVDPCDNFYEYACGSWIASAKVPTDQSELLLSWDETQDRVDLEVRKLMEQQAPEDSPMESVNKWYKSCMDEESIEEAGASPLKIFLDEIDAVETEEQLHSIIARFINTGIFIFINWRVEPYVLDRGSYAIILDLPNFMLPSLSYYLDANEAGMREVLRTFLIDTAILAGYPRAEAENSAEESISIEQELAGWIAQENDAMPQAGPMAVNMSTLVERYPGIPWRAILTRLTDHCETVGFDCLQSVKRDADKFLFIDLSYLERLSFALHTRPARSWIPLLRHSLIHWAAPFLDSRFRNAEFQLRRGLTAGFLPQPRWKFCIQRTGEALPSMTDMMFVSKFFTPQDSKVGGEVIRRLKTSFIHRLQNANWLDDPTRRRALSKAESMALNIGAPNNYMFLRQPVSSSFFNNSLKAGSLNFLEKLSLVDVKVDRSLWKLPADTVNAWYDGAVNAIFIPAGIMQPPFFDRSKLAAQNFGGIGTVVGHEITHGFDTKGSLLNENGEPESWWTAETRKRFQERLSCIEELYDRFRIAGVPVDGINTAAENVADMGGVAVSLQAFREWHREKLKSEASQGMVQVFFLSYAQLWCEKQRSAITERFLVSRDPHAPKPFRVNAVVSQNPSFAESFSCPAGSPMNPHQKCKLW